MVKLQKNMDNQKVINVSAFEENVEKYLAQSNLEFC